MAYKPVYVHVQLGLIKNAAVILRQRFLSERLLLMVVRLVSHRQTLALQFLTALAVDLQAAVDLVDLAVVLKNSAHVVQHPHNSFAHRGGMVLRSCRCGLPCLTGWL